MKNAKLLLLPFFILMLVNAKIVHAQDDIIIPESDDETFVPPAPGSEATNPPVILDESDSNDVSDTEEYDG